VGISGIHEARTRLQPRRIRGHGQGKQGATYVNRSRPQCGLYLGHSRTNRRCLVPGLGLDMAAAPYYRPLALLLPLLCLGLLHADSAASITAGTPDGSELWGYVQVRPSNAPISRHLPSHHVLAVPSSGRRLPYHCLRSVSSSLQRRTCSGGTTRARRGRRRRGSHGRPSSGCRAARYEPVSPPVLLLLLLCFKRTWPVTSPV